MSTLPIRDKSRATRFVRSITASTIGSWNDPGNTRRFLHDWLQNPIRFAAQKAIESTPEKTFAEFFSVTLEGNIQVEVAGEDLSRHSWNVRLDEQIIIGLAVKHLKARRIFEIGTFNGRTTRYLAENAGPEARVFTLDLPPAEVDAFENASFKGSQIGEVYRGTPVAPQITQLAGNSLTFNYDEYEHSMDFVFVDAAHDYRHGYADTLSALRLVRPGGVIFWHDFVPQWAGLVDGVKEATAGLPLVRLSGTSFAALRTEAKS